MEHNCEGNGGIKRVLFIPYKQKSEPLIECPGSNAIHWFSWIERGLHGYSEPNDDFNSKFYINIIAN